MENIFLFLIISLGLIAFATESTFLIIVFFAIIVFIIIRIVADTKNQRTQKEKARQIINDLGVSYNNGNLRLKKGHFNWRTL